MLMKNRYKWLKCDGDKLLHIIVNRTWFIYIRWGENTFLWIMLYLNEWRNSDVIIGLISIYFFWQFQNVQNMNESEHHYNGLCHYYKRHFLFCLIIIRKWILMLQQSQHIYFDPILFSWDVSMFGICIHTVIILISKLCNNNSLKWS